MSHDPTVTAAVVTVVGAGGVAIVSFFTTAWSTRRTLESSERSSRAALEASSAAAMQAARAERSHRLWERRTEVYRRLIARTSEQQELRDRALTQLREALGNGTPWLWVNELEPWNSLNSDLVTYGSDTVHKIAISYETDHRLFVRLLKDKTAAKLNQAAEVHKTASAKLREVVFLVRAETQTLD